MDSFCYTTAGRGKILGGSAPDAGFRANGRTARAPGAQPRGPWSWDATTRWPTHATPTVRLSSVRDSVPGAEA